MDRVIAAQTVAGDLVLVTEAQQTQRALTALIVLLLVVAGLLAILTFWYWRHTNPRRRVKRFLVDPERTPYDDGYASFDLDDDYQPDGGQYIDLDQDRQRASSFYR